jgi:AcrR family transcriptional regulator
MMCSHQQRGQETYARLIEAAVECFAEQGYDATGVARICRRAGVSKGAFYHHFSSKQKLFLALQESWLAGLDAQMEAVRSGAETVPEALLRMVDLIAPVFDAADGQLAVFLEFWTKACHDTDIWQATIAPYRRYRAYFMRMIEDGIAEGAFRPVDPEMAAQVLVSLAVGLLQQRLLDPEGADWGQVAHRGVRMFLDSLEIK